MNRSWQYLVNPFLVATNDSFVLAQLISNYHLSALRGGISDPYFESMYKAYLPLHETYDTSFAKWKARQQSQTGKTLTLTQLLAGLTDKVNRWEHGILWVHPKGTPAFQALLGGGHSPFTNGTQTSRIAAVKALSENLKDKEGLKDVKEDVDKYAQLLHDALDNKDTAKHTTGNYSDELENARIAICTQQYIHLGMLISKFARNPESIEKYFDTAHIRNTGNGGKSEDPNPEGGNQPAE